MITATAMTVPIPSPVARTSPTVRACRIRTRRAADTYVTVFGQTAQAAVRATAELLLSHARIRMSLEGASQA